MPIKQLLLNLHGTRRKGETAARRKVLSKVLEGSWETVLKGRGMEFAGYRRYEYGDDASKIDWNASLRSKDTLVREYEEYRTVNVFFMLDVNDSMLFTTQEQLKCEYAAEMLYHFARAIIDTGDAVGYALYNNDIIAHQFPSIGSDVLYRLERDLRDGANYGGLADFKHSVMMVNGMLSERALIVIISDFTTLPPGWERYVRMLATQCDLIGVMVRDPRDSEIEAVGVQAVVEDPSGREPSMLIDLRQYAALYESETERQEVYIQRVFKKARAGFLKLDTTKEPIDQLIRYFRQRQRVLRA